MSNAMRTAAWMLVLGGSCLAGATIRAQTLDYVKSDGCADVFLYGWNEARNEVIVVRANRDKLGLNVGTTKLNLAGGRDGLDVYVDLYAHPLPGVDYCTDAKRHDEPRPSATLRAHSGEVTVTLGERGGVKEAQSFMYEAIVTLRNLVFRRPDGTILSTKGPITLKAVVGYYWG